MRTGLRLPSAEVSDTELGLLIESLDEDASGSLSIDEIVAFIQRDVSSFLAPCAVPASTLDRLNVVPRSPASSQRTHSPQQLVSSDGSRYSTERYSERRAATPPTPGRRVSPPLRRH